MKRNAGPDSISRGAPVFLYWYGEDGYSEETGYYNGKYTILQNIRKELRLPDDDRGNSHRSHGDFSTQTQSLRQCNDTRNDSRCSFPSVCTLRGNNRVVQPRRWGSPMLTYKCERWIVPDNSPSYQSGSLCLFSTSISGFTKPMLRQWNENISSFEGQSTKLRLVTERLNGELRP